MLVGLCASALAVSVSTTSLSVALPDLVRDVDAVPGQAPWIVNAYTVVLAALIIPCGVWGDRVGPRVPLLLGSACFGTGSVVCALSASPESLVCGRAVMGVGAAALLPLSSSTVARAFPGSERSRAVAIWAGVITLGAPLGLLVGASAAELGGWQTVFWANLPLVVVGAVLTSRARLSLPPAVGTPPLSLRRLALRAAGLVILSWGLAGPIGADSDGLGTVSTVTLGSAAVVAASARRRSGTGAWPLGPAGVRARTSYWCATVVAAVGNLLVAVTYFLVPLISAASHGADAAAISLVLVPGLAAGLVGNATANRLRRRWGDPAVVAAGFVLLAACFALAAVHSEPPSLTWLSGWVAVEGLGISLILLTAVDVALGCGSCSVSPGRLSAVTQTWRQMGVAVGVTLAGAAVVLHSTAGGQAPGVASSPGLLDATRSTAVVLLVVVLIAGVYAVLGLRLPAADGADGADGEGTGGR